MNFHLAIRANLVTSAVRRIAMGAGVVLAMANCPALAGETMTERCSAEVAFPPNFGARPDAPNTVILKRGPSGTSAWTPPFRVQLSRNGHIRWWCHSTIGNAFDVGTYRLDVKPGFKCDLQSLSCNFNPAIKVGSSAWNGFTAERSRCDDRSTLIRARLDTKRRLEIQCLGR